MKGVDEVYANKDPTNPKDKLFIDAKVHDDSFDPKNESSIVIDNSSLTSPAINPLAVSNFVFDNPKVQEFSLNYWDNIDSRTGNSLQVLGQL